MKNKLIPFVFVVAVSVIAFIAASQKPVVASESVKAHSVVVLRAQEKYLCVNQGLGAGNQCFAVDFEITCESNMAGTLSAGQMLAPRLAQLLDQGYHIENIQNLVYTLVR